MNMTSGLRLEIRRTLKATRNQLIVRDYPERAVILRRFCEITLNRPLYYNFVGYAERAIVLRRFCGIALKGFKNIGRGEAPACSDDGGGTPTG